MLTVLFAAPSLWPEYRDTLPQALTEAGFQGITLPPIGLAPEVPDMIADSIRAALS